MDLGKLSECTGVLEKHAVDWEGCVCICERYSIG